MRFSTNASEIELEKASIAGRDEAQLPSKILVVSSNLASEAFLGTVAEVTGGLTALAGNRHLDRQ